MRPRIGRWYNPFIDGYQNRLDSIRLPTHRIKKATDYPTAGDIVKALKDFDFMKITPESITELTNVLAKYYIQDHEPIPLGKYGVIDYSISIEPLGEGSLNPEAPATGRTTDTLEVLKNLRFTNKNVAGLRGVAELRHAIAIGRLVATHHFEENFLQSHWIVMLDQTRMLWALFAKDIDVEDDMAASRYCYNSDTAFGANRVGGENVILLGHIENLAFEEGFDLRKCVQASAMEWSTSSTEHKKSVRRLVSPKYIDDLLAVNLKDAAIKVPAFQVRMIMDRNYGDLYSLRDKIGYLQFCDAVQVMNEKKPVSRELMEGAWGQVVVEAYQNMDVVKRNKLGRSKLQHNLECFSDCLFQCHESASQMYWIQKAAEHPDSFNVESAPHDRMKDHKPELIQWVKNMMQTNKSKAVTRNRALEFISKMRGVDENAMDVDESEAEAGSALTIPVVGDNRVL